MKRVKNSHDRRSDRQTVSRLIPYETIEAAINGDETAIDEIVRNYGGYIQRLVGKESYTSDGKSYFIVDKTKASIMKSALTEKIAKFNLQH